MSSGVANAAHTVTDSVTDSVIDSVTDSVTDGVAAAVGGKTVDAIGGNGEEGVGGTTGHAGDYVGAVEWTLAHCSVVVGVHPDQAV
jgi:hypothetical protein